MARLKGKKIGVLGGTFDPPHIGHQILAADAQEQLNLDVILWMLTPFPPHKTNEVITSTDHRMQMVELAIAGNPWFTLSRIDVDRNPPHYAVDTMQLLHKQAPWDEFYYLMGLDSLNDLLQRYEPEEFVNQCDRIVVMLRYGESLEISTLVTEVPELKSKLHFLQTPSVDISSSDIRSRLSTGRQYRYFLPENVYQYIESNHLYQR